MMEFFESIKLLDGQLYNEAYHLQRMQRTLKSFNSHNFMLDKLPLDDDLKITNGLYKYKIVYNLDGIISTSASPYKKRSVEKVYYVSYDNLNYGYKFSDREELKSHNLLLDDHEEVIYVKHGMITDAIYSNVAYWDGTQWFTPKFPLLKGTKRAQLIAEGKIKEVVILKSDLEKYKRISFINALNDLDETTLDIIE
jgi:4-amino-4-deoxychorismate lyase